MVQRTEQLSNYRVGKQVRPQIMMRKFCQKWNRENLLWRVNFLIISQRFGHH